MLPKTTKPRTADILWLLSIRVGGLSTAAAAAAAADGPVLLCVQIVEVYTGSACL